MVRERGAQRPPNSTIPAMRSEPKNAPPPGCKIEEGGLLGGSVDPAQAAPGERALAHDSLRLRESRARREGKGEERVNLSMPFWISLSHRSRIPVAASGKGCQPGFGIRRIPCRRATCRNNRAGGKKILPVAALLRLSRFPSIFFGVAPPLPATISCKNRSFSSRATYRLETKVTLTPQDNKRTNGKVAGRWDPAAEDRLRRISPRGTRDVNPTQLQVATPRRNN